MGVRMKGACYCTALLFLCLIGVASCAPTPVDRKLAAPLFMKWLQDNQFPHAPAVYDAERDVMVAVEPINGEEIAITIPSRFVLSIDTVKASPMNICIEPQNDLGEPACVVLYFVYEFLKPDSYWTPYFNMLPRDLSHLPLYWTSEELDQLQALRAFMETRRNVTRWMVDTLYEKVKVFVAAHPELFPNPSLITHELWEWAVLIFRSRSFQYKDLTTSCLIAWNDMFNHAERWEKMQMWGYSQVWTPEKSLAVKFGRSFAVGQEVQSVYTAQFTSIQFLAEYGFVPRGGYYVNDYIETNVPILLESDPYYKEKEIILRKYKVFTSYNEKNIYFFQDGIPRATIGGLRISELTPTQWEEAKASNVSVDFFLKDPYSLENEWTVNRRMMKVVNAQLAQFPTTAEQDNELLLSPTITSLYNNRMINAIAARKYYKDILLKARQDIIASWDALLFV